MFTLFFNTLRTYFVYRLIRILLQYSAFNFRRAPILRLHPFKEAMSFHRVVSGLREGLNHSFEWAIS